MPHLREASIIYSGKTEGARNQGLMGYISCIVREAASLVQVICHLTFAPTEALHKLYCRLSWPLTLKTTKGLGDHLAHSCAVESPNRGTVGKYDFQDLTQLWGIQYF